MALSHGIEASELDKKIKELTKALSNNVSVSGLNFIVCFATSMITEVVRHHFGSVLVKNFIDSKHSQVRQRGNGQLILRSQHGE